MDEQGREAETRDQLAAFVAAAIEVALDTDSYAPASDFGLAVKSYKAEEPDDKGGRAVLVTLEDGRAYRVYASVVPAYDEDRIDGNGRITDDNEPVL